MKSESLRSGDNYMKSEITSHDESSNLNRPYTAFEFKTELVYKIGMMKNGRGRR